jgi:GNAT superfamily N-acetyltransferase
MHEKVTVARAGVETVDDLRPLFLALHRHHRAVAELPLVADDEAWRARRVTYLAWFAEGRALLFVASAQETPVGYALVVWHEGANDTFPLAPRYAEVYTLSVAEEARGAGVGGRLLEAVDEALADEGDPPLAIAVMAGNTDALRFYARRGLVPGELLLYRFHAARADPASADALPP